MVSLTQKETMLLKDLKGHEEWCVKKYTDYATLAQDEELKKMFKKFAQQERNHYDTLDKILNGQVPNVSQGQQAQPMQFSPTQPSPTAQPTAQPAPTMQFGGTPSQSQNQQPSTQQPPKPATTNNPFTKSWQQANKAQNAKAAPQPNSQVNVEYEFGDDTPVRTNKANVNQRDIDLCYDMLNTEKYVSSTYDTVIFECKDKSIRQTLNHIQKEEQEHGEAIYNWLQSKGAYPAQ